MHNSMLRTMPPSDPGAPSRLGHGSKFKREDVEATFLASLKQYGVVSAAAQASGMTRRALYSRRANNPAFAQAWAQALEDFEESLTHRVVQTALELGTGKWVPEIGPDGKPVYERDEMGRLVLDEDFDPIPLYRFDCSNVDSRIAAKLMSLRMKSVNEIPAVQVNNGFMVEAPKRPRLVRPATPAVDIEAEAIDVTENTDEEI